MKIQIFDVIKQGVSLSFKDKTVLGLIILYSVLGIISSILMAPLMTELEKFMTELEKLNEATYPLVFPALGINEWLTIFALSVVSIIILYAIVKAAFERLNKKEISISNAIISTLKKFIPIFIASIIYFIIVIIGLVALIIPGIFLTIVLFFYGHAILLNNRGIIASLKESYNIIRGNWWQIFTLYFILIIISIFLGFLFGFLAFFLHPHLTRAIEIISIIAVYFVTGIWMVVYTIAYFQLIEKEKKIRVENPEVIQEKRQKKKQIHDLRVQKNKIF